LTGSINTPSVSQNLRCLGRLQVATTGQQADNINIGQLWFTYKVKLSKPRAPPPGNMGGFFHATSSTGITTGDAALKNYQVFYDSTAGANGVGITATNTLSLAGLRPNTVVDLTYNLKYKSGSSVVVTLGAITPTSANAIQDFFYDSGAAVSTFVIDSSSPGGTSNAYATYQASYLITEATYATPAKLVFTAPTIAGTSPNIIWDLRIILRPLVSGNNAVLAAPDHMIVVEQYEDDDDYKHI
jgi:hypothetical protein